MKQTMYIDGNDLYLSKGYLKSFASLKTIEKWNGIRYIVKTKVDNEIYFLYKSIPFRTRKKLLPSDKIISVENKKHAHSIVKDLLHEAYYYKYVTYKSIYEKEITFNTSKVTEFAKLHSVFQSIIDFKKKEGFRNLIILHGAFNYLFPGKYKTKQAFSQAILKAAVDGVMSVAMDKRTFGNNDRSKKETTPQVDYIISALVSCNGKFTNAVMIEKANAYFKEKGLKEMSFSWMKKQRREWLKNPEIYKNRYGQTEAQKIMPFASLKNANLTHIQWQVDGFNLPFWEDKFHRSVLVFVIDNCSKKIIGYAIGNSENSEVIKTALRKAVYNTGVLPFEVVMDKHSFTQTQSALNFEDLLIKNGARLTKTSNPRQKVIVERYIQNLDSLFKEYYGYLGKSIRSKSIEDITSDEQKTEYAKNFKSHSEIVCIVTEVIENYNSKNQKGVSPNQSFIENSHPNPIVPNQFHRSELLPYQILKQIRRGQVTIMRGVEKFEYQLPAELFQEWNNQTVIVTHDDLRDGIYILNKNNSEGIAFLPEKFKINNSKELQTDEDINALYRNKGRLKGIETKARKQLASITDKALNIDPEAHLSLSQLVTPKNVIKELEQNANLKIQVQQNGVHLNELDTSEQSFELPSSLKPAQKDKNPFSSKNNKIELINPQKGHENE